METEGSENIWKIEKQREREREGDYYVRKI
jgi:hypothetical protein